MQERGRLHLIRRFGFGRSTHADAVTEEELSRLAERAHQYSGAPSPFPDPQHIAVGLGFTLLPRAPRFCGDGAERGCVRFEYNADSQAMGMSVFHSLAHCILRDERDGGSEEDAVQLATMLVVPRFAVDLVRENPRLAATHAPMAVVLRSLSAASRTVAI